MLAAGSGDLDEEICAAKDIAEQRKRGFAVFLIFSHDSASPPLLSQGNRTSCRASSRRVTHLRSLSFVTADREARSTTVLRASLDKASW